MNPQLFKSVDKKTSAGGQPAAAYFLTPWQALSGRRFHLWPIVLHLSDFVLFVMGRNKKGCRRGPIDGVAKKAWSSISRHWGRRW